MRKCDTRIHEGYGNWETWSAAYTMMENKQVARLAKQSGSLGAFLMQLHKHKIWQTDHGISWINSKIDFNRIRRIINCKEDL